MKESFYGRENPHLLETLLSDLPQILNWALDGLDRLRERGRFVPPRSSEQAVEELVEAASPLAGFLRERCEVGPGREVACHALYEQYVAWCGVSGHRVASQQKVGRDLRSLLPHLQITQRDLPHKKGTRFYVGITLA
jgi:putative DNA primase/helicase